MSLKFVVLEPNAVCSEIIFLGCVGFGFVGLRLCFSDLEVCDFGLLTWRIFMGQFELEFLGLDCKLHFVGLEFVSLKCVGL